MKHLLENKLKNRTVTLSILLLGEALVMKQLLLHF